MKKSTVTYLPLLGITFTLAIAGIEVFQTGEQNLPGMKLAETIFVITLAALFGLGIIISKKGQKQYLRVCRLMMSYPVSQ